MKDIMTPVPVEEVRAVIKKCLENAALINYNKLASEAKVEGENPRNSCFSIFFFHFLTCCFWISRCFLSCLGAETTIQGNVAFFLAWNLSFHFDLFYLSNRVYLKESLS